MFTVVLSVVLLTLPNGFLSCNNRRNDINLVELLHNKFINDSGIDNLYEYTNSTWVQSLTGLYNESKVSSCWTEVRRSLNNKDLSVNVDPEVYMNVSELITSKEYPCEDHYVTTFDGYILSLQRIPFGNVQNKTTGGRPVVFLQHGLLGDGTNWVTNLVNQSFAFILADAGYDVWIGNLRGTTYSKKHVNLSPKRRQFWKWSWDEMAKYDVPAMINYALKISRQSQLYYIGHSQGTTVGFASFSSNADIAKKVKLFIAFGPVTTTEHISSPIRIFSDSYLYKPIEDVLKLLNLHEFLPTGEFFDFLARVCAHEKLGILCESVLFMLEGYDCHRMNTSRIPIYLGHTPAGTSLQNIVHWMQMIQSGKFQMYNYGLIENLVHYKQIRPPVYDVGAMETPVALYWGEWDMLADPLDVELLIPKLKNIVVKRKLERFDHFDFVWAMDAIYVLYNDVIKLMQQY